MKNVPEATCPIARSVAFVGDAWSLLILRDASLGLTRFDEFRKSLGIAPTMLTRRLATLTEEGLLEKRRYSERPPREEYLLTAAGRDFLPVLFMIGDVGTKTPRRRQADALRGRRDRKRNPADCRGHCDGGQDRHPPNSSRGPESESNSVSRKIHR